MLAPPDYSQKVILEWLSTANPPMPQGFADPTLPPWFTLEELSKACSGIVAEAAKARSPVKLEHVRKEMLAERLRRIANHGANRRGVRGDLFPTKSERDRAFERSAAGMRIIRALMAKREPELTTELDRELYEIIKPNFDIGAPQTRDAVDKENERKERYGEKRKKY